MDELGKEAVYRVCFVRYLHAPSVRQLLINPPNRVCLFVIVECLPGPVQVTVLCPSCTALPSTPSPGPAATSSSPNFDRVPAIISVSATLVATVALGAVLLLQLRERVVEVVVGIAAVGFDYGGVGGGVLGLDLGLFQVANGSAHYPLHHPILALSCHFSLSRMWVVPKTAVPVRAPNACRCLNVLDPVAPLLVRVLCTCS